MLVVGDLLAAGHLHLHLVDVASLFRKPAEQQAERFEPLGNALGVIEAVHSEDHGISRQAPPDLGGVRFDLWLRRLASKFLEIDADGEGADYGVPSLETDLGIRCAGLDKSLRKQALQAAYEIGAVVVALES